MESIMSAIQRQPTVHLGQIASFLPLRELARCQEMCRIFRDHLIVPPVQVAGIPAEKIERLKNFTQMLKTAAKVRIPVELTLSIGFESNEPIDLYSIAPEIRLALFNTTFSKGSSPVPATENSRFVPFIRSSPHLRGIGIPILTPPIATALAESCPHLRLLSATCIDNLAIGILAECPQLTAIRLKHPYFPNQEDLSMPFSQLSRLQSLSLKQWLLSDEILGALPPSLHTLELENCAGYTQNGQVAFLTRHPLLEIYRAKNINDLVLRALPPRIHTLYLDTSQNFTDAALLHFATTHPSTIGLSIWNSRKISISTLERLGDLCPHLRDLHLGYSGVYTFEELRPLVIRHFPSLKGINFSHEIHGLIARKVEDYPIKDKETLAQIWEITW
jgi:hypothetical protein